ncbi:MAG: guanylate kinase [Burkholderiales bacterium]|nr:guanylate kinase [Burkholderiales bacterium]
MPGILFIVSAPSGGGKTSLVRALLEDEPGVVLSISHTTRAPRPGETEGTHYHFVSRDGFERMRAAGEFLESAEIYGHLYGTSREGIAGQLASGHDVLLEIDWQGARQVRELMPAVAIFILPPSIDVLRSRLMARAQDGTEVIARRLAMAEEEMARVVDYDYVIINEDFGRAALDLRSIIRAERLKRSRQHARHGDFIKR